MPRLACIVCPPTHPNLSDEISIYDMPYTWDYVCNSCNEAEEMAKFQADYAGLR